MWVPLGASWQIWLYDCAQHLWMSLLPGMAMWPVSQLLWPVLFLLSLFHFLAVCHTYALNQLRWNSGDRWWYLWFNRRCCFAKWSHVQCSVWRRNTGHNLCCACIQFRYHFRHRHLVAFPQRGHSCMFPWSSAAIYNLALFDMLNVNQILIVWSHQW